MASAGKNHRRAPKTTKGTYGKQIAVVRENFSVGAVVTVEALKSRFPAVFPGNGPSNAWNFLQEARRKRHIGEDNSLLAPEVLVKESLTGGSSPASSNSNGDDGTCAINPADDATVEVALFWEGEPFKKGDRFKAGQLRQRKPFFEKYYAASIGQFLLELSKKKRPLLTKNTDGTWSLTDEGLKRQRELRAPKAVPVSSPVKPTVGPVTSTAVEAAKPRLPVPVAVAAEESAAVVPIPTLMEEISMPLSPVSKPMDSRTYKLGQKFVKLLSICRRLGISVINDGVIRRVFKEFGSYKNERSLSATIYNQAQKDVIFEALDRGGYRFRSDYIAAVDAGFYGGDAVVPEPREELSPPVAPEPSAEGEQPEAEAAEPLSEASESLDEPEENLSEDEVEEGSEEPEPEPDLESEPELKSALPPAENHEGGHPTKKESVTRRVSRHHHLGTSLDQKLDEARKTVEGLSALVEGFPQKVQEIVGAALAAQAQRFETQLQEQQAQHAEQMRILREQAEALCHLEEDSRAQLIRERLAYARDVAVLQRGLEGFHTLGISYEALRRRVNFLEKDAVTLGDLEVRVGGLEEDFGAAQELVALAKHAGQVLSKFRK